MLRQKRPEVRRCRLPAVTQFADTFRRTKRTASDRLLLRRERPLPAHAVTSHSPQTSLQGGVVAGTMSGSFTVKLVFRARSSRTSCRQIVRSAVLAVPRQPSPPSRVSTYGWHRRSPLQLGTLLQRPIFSAPVPSEST